MNVATISLDEKQLTRLVELVADVVIRRLEATTPTGPRPVLASEILARDRLTYVEVALALGVKTQTVRRWVCEERYGFPRGVKYGKTRYFIGSEIEEWLQARRGAV